MRSGTKTIFTCLSVFLIVWLGIRYLLPLTLPFLLGTGLALTAEPVVSFFCRHMRLPRPLAAGIGVSMAFFCIALLLLLVCAFLVRELRLLAGVMPDLEDTARAGISSLEGWLLELTSHTPQSIRPVLSRNVTNFFSDGTALLEKVVRYVLGLAGGLLSRVPDSALGLGTGVISAFMISAKLPKIRSWVTRHLPREKLRPILQAMKRMKTAIGGWLLAQLKLAGVTMAILAAGFLLLRIPYAPLWALAVSLIDSLPVLGTGAVLLPWALICLLQQETARAIGLVGIYVVISITRSVLEPKFLGRQLGLDPLVTLFALYAGYKLWGIGGMLLAPLLAVTAIQLVPGKKGG